jgi:hypothetical protein
LIHRAPGTRSISTIWHVNESSRMYKLIAILVAAMPVILFLRTVFFKQSKVMKEASSAFRKQVDYLVWTILFLVACALVYSVGTLAYSFWK